MKTYVCRRARLCSYLRGQGFSPYRVVPDKDNPVFDVFLFDATPELYTAVMEYVARTTDKELTKEGPYGNQSKSENNNDCI